MKHFVTAQLSENISVTPEGYLLCLNVAIRRTGRLSYAAGELIAAEGEVVEVGADGFVHLECDADELFRVETLASFEGKPLTISHPEDDAGNDVWVSPENWTIYAKGILQDPRRGDGEDADKMLLSILVTTQEAIDAIQSGVRQISAGYDFKFVPTGLGTGKQTCIIGNHAALVIRGRAGKDCAITDAAPSGATDEEETMSKEQVTPTFKEKVSRAIDAFKAALEELGGGADAVVEITAPVVTIPAAVTVAATDADMSGLIANLQSELAYCMSSYAELGERVAVLNEAIGKLGGAGSMAAADAAPAALDPEVLSRAEILAPGIKPTTTIKADALKVFYATDTGKETLTALAGGEPDFENAAEVNVLFKSAAYSLESSRSVAAAPVRATDAALAKSLATCARTPAEINAANAKHYTNR